MLASRILARSLELHQATGLPARWCLAEAIACLCADRSHHFRTALAAVLSEPKATP